MKLPPLLGLCVLVGLSLGISPATTVGTDPQMLPAVVVTGWVEDDYSYLAGQLIWTIPYNTYGSQNTMGWQLRPPGIAAYGRMLVRPIPLGGPTHYLGNPGYVKTSHVIVDTDGDPREHGYDPKNSLYTSVVPTLNSAYTPYVAYTDAAVAAGVRPGDWAQVQNPSNGSWIWAICGDYCDGHPEGEISEACCYLMGWPFYASSNTQFVYSVTIKYFPHSKGL